MTLDRTDWHKLCLLALFTAFHRLALLSSQPTIRPPSTPPTPARSPSYINPNPPLAWRHAAFTSPAPPQRARPPQQHQQGAWALRGHRRRRSRRRTSGRPRPCRPAVLVWFGAVCRRGGVWGGGVWDGAVCAGVVAGKKKARHRCMGRGWMASVESVDRYMQTPITIQYLSHKKHLGGG